MSHCQAPSPIKKIGWVSPFPPVKSGISVYSEALLKELTKNNEFVFTPISAVSDKKRISLKNVKKKEYDLLIYSIGNHPLHLLSYERALKETGIIFLHDMNLHDLLYFRSIKSKNPFLYLKYLLNESGDFETIKKIVKNQGQDRNLFINFPLIKELVLSNNYFIVHSEYAKKMIKEINVDAEVLKINHICPWAERIERKNSEKIIIGIFGYLSKDRHIDKTIDVFKKFLPNSKKQIVLRFVGEDVDINLENIIDEKGVRKNIEIYRNVDDDNFLKLMKECDYAINIRHPVRGEMSSNLMKFIGFGIPTAIVYEKSFKDIPENCIFPVKMDDFENSLFKFFLLIDSNDGSLKNISENAYNFAKNECNAFKISQQIIEFIKIFDPNKKGKSLRKLKPKEILKIYGFEKSLKLYIKSLL
ncbi:MAG: Glycosyl transferase, group 1 [candidate division TA06 bacterium 32_111]|nr:MAG: Glycosyl transferase, group 1 [candidate division TA06 bacterium 32_111]KUK86588.1 MAG: Glycosyl transferase, group 1 [candidate division TA06 bacterium 34_109]